MLLLLKRINESRQTTKNNWTRHYCHFNCKFTRCIHKLGLWNCCICFIRKRSGKGLDGLDYRLAIASSYSGFLIWHAGLSASIPLTLATGGETLIKTTAGSIKEAIPITETLFSPYALVPVIISHYDASH